MKLILSGGVNGTLTKTDPTYNTYGFGNFFMVQIKNELNTLIDDGKTIAVCVAAKPNKNHYDTRFTDMGFKLGNFTFLGREDGAEWSSYHAVLILGGETKELHKWLERTGFILNKLTNCELLAGDSAGAYVLTSNTIVDYNADGSMYSIIEGFIPELQLLVAAHVNNSYYHTAKLGQQLKEWSEGRSLKYLELEENEIKVIDQKT